MVVIIPLMAPKMEEQVQIRVVDLVVEVEVAKILPTQELVVVVVLMDIMVVMDHHLLLLNAVVVAVEPVLLELLVVLVELMVMVEPKFQILSQVHQEIMLVEVVEETTKVETQP